MQKFKSKFSFVSILDTLIETIRLKKDVLDYIHLIIKSFDLGCYELMDRCKLKHLSTWPDKLRVVILPKQTSISAIIAFALVGTTITKTPNTFPIVKSTARHASVTTSETKASGM